MTSESKKVTNEHLARDAYLYVRQSTMRQVVENQESTQRQYGLRHRAIALGWPAEQVKVVDDDQGLSGASAVDREGFQRLVTEVGMGRVGIVLGLEVSRLARSSSDWHRLLEICALAGTLILDEDGVYDPKDFNDRLLLGLKGTMSEAELHVLRGRMRGGLLNKARRGELHTWLPVGFVYDASGAVRLDPDQQIQQAIRHLFETYPKAGSAPATVRAFRAEGLLFPHKDPYRGELSWRPLTTGKVLRVLYNPRYAGAFAWGQRASKTVPGRKLVTHVQPRAKWHALVKNVHEGYITWEEYERNLERLKESARAYWHGTERSKGPPREGCALLQGIAICGVCGERMTVRYRVRGHDKGARYCCKRHSAEDAAPPCQDINGTDVDKAVAAALLDAVSPLALEVALQVQQEVEGRSEQADRLRRKQLERAQYEADVARRRFMQVEPENRLVAVTLESEWNQKLRAAKDALEEYERKRTAEQQVLTDDGRAKVLRLVSDFPAMWNEPKTPDRERKRMVRLLLEDVTLKRTDKIEVSLRFKGGPTKVLTVPLRPRTCDFFKPAPNVVAEIDRLLDQHHEAKVAEALNEQGLRLASGNYYRQSTVLSIVRRCKLKSREQRLRARGMLTQGEVARRLGVWPITVRKWRKHGLLAAHRINGRRFLYENPGKGPAAKMKDGQLIKKRWLRSPVFPKTRGGAV
jgi:DNA invertase Pin-like site-specific DNA recombinase